MDSWLFNGDCLEELKFLSKNSVHALITDPPAGISFMGKDWDGNKGGRKEWCAWMESVMRECFRVMKPGAHGLVWALPRTSHWTATALEDAGFEIRDVVTHLFGSGFPKASALNRQNRDAFCQCALDRHNTEHKDPLLHVDAHSDNQNASFDDGPQFSNDQHSMHKPSDSQDDCHTSDDLCGEHAQNLSGSGLMSFLQQECAPIRNRSDEILDETASEPLHNPSLVQYIDRPSSQGSQSLDYALPSKEICTSLSRKQKQKTHCDIARQECGSGHKNELSLALGKHKKFPQECQTCGKPNPKGWYNGGLKPASEHWILIRRPCSEKTVASNVLKHGVGGLNIDASRVEAGADLNELNRPNKRPGSGASGFMTSVSREFTPSQGRFPANLILSHSDHCTDDQCDLECPVKMLDGQSGVLRTGGSKSLQTKPGSFGGGGGITQKTHAGSEGGASRFFYCSKASKADKNAGLDKPSTHPTVKSTKLMQYLIKLITPPGGTVLDPFMGSGSTGVAAKALGFDFIGIERESEYFEIAKKRIRR